jgi:hypothetical protein
VKKFRLEPLTLGEGNALMEIFLRGLSTDKRSTPDELRVVEKLTKLGNELEDAR